MARTHLKCRHCARSIIFSAQHYRRSSASPLLPATKRRPLSLHHAMAAASSPTEARETLRKHSAGGTAVGVEDATQVVFLGSLPTFLDTSSPMDGLAWRRKGWGEPSRSGVGAEGYSAEGEAMQRMTKKKSNPEPRWKKCREC
jgi:hypothetical protein